MGASGPGGREALGASLPKKLTKSMSCAPRHGRNAVRRVLAYRLTKKAFEMSGRNNYFGDGLNYRVRRDIISCNKGVIDFKKSELISLNKLLYALVLPTSIIYIYITT